MVNTVLGPRKLGRTLIHEHVLIGYPGWFMDNRMPRFVREEALARVVDAFQALHDYGIRTVVDPCPMDLGRDVTFNAEVSQRSGIDLVCAVGGYFEAQGIPFTFRPIACWSAIAAAETTTRTRNRWPSAAPMSVLTDSASKSSTPTNVGCATSSNSWMPDSATG